MAIIDARCEVPDGRCGRIDRVVQELTGRSRADVRGLFDSECVRLNGETCLEAGVRVNPGDTVSVRHDPHRRYHEVPTARKSPAFELVFEDESLIVVAKAAGVLTVPTDRGEPTTLIEAVSRHLSRGRAARRAAVVHRLDRETSGLLVFGKDREIAREVQDQFRVRKAEREYTACVGGTMQSGEGTFRSNLRTTKSRQRYSARAGERGEEAVTHFVVQQQLQGATFVRVRLETGRRNQIRVHFAEAEHPVLGDERYRPKLARHPSWKVRRLALHATVLGFEHPKTRERMRFESPMPAEMMRFVASQGPHRRRAR